jgi:hypothetical protein
MNTKESDDPMFGLVRVDADGRPRDVIVSWSQMTEEERAAAWREYERAYCPAARTESRR